MTTRDDCGQLFERVKRAAASLGVRDVEATIGAHRSALTRFANNEIHQNVAERGGYVSVRVLIDGRTARAGTNRLDDDGVRKVVSEALALARLQVPDPDLLPLWNKSPGVSAERYFVATAEATPEDRGRVVANAIGVVESAGQTAAGIYSTSESVLSIFNSSGLSAFHRETMAQFSITAMEGDSSGWAKATACNATDLDAVALASRASYKASASRAPGELPPGAYTVILEPAAALDLVGQIFGDFSATALRDERSFLTERIGRALFGTNVSIGDDAYHPRQAGPPFDGEGVERKKLALVENGVPAGVAYSRGAAAHVGLEPTGHGFPLPDEYGEAPMNIVIQGGATSLEEMIASTHSGILITRLWYIREVDPYEKIMTGMTRDGTFEIRDGRITRGLRNFRFNQSVIELLSNVEALSPATRASGEEAFDMVVPAIKVSNFRFTETTKY